jgi:CBS domain-containing protein/PII-like signaling protein
MLNYKAIEIFTSEEARHGKKPLADAVVQFIRNLKIAARCIVTRGVAGCYESGELTTNRLEVLSYNLPVRIYIVIPAAETQRVLDGLNGMVGDGIVALHDLHVLSHRARNAFFPRQLMVRDVMTPEPKSVMATTPLREVAGILLPSIFTGLPVVDELGRPIGLITQGDLIRKGGLPFRLGLLEESDHNHRESLLDQLAKRQAFEIMTTPVIMIERDRPLADAVGLMLSKTVKRLPVVDGQGRLVGMVSRLDIFRTVMREAPDWNDFRSQRIEVQHLKTVKDILRRDTSTVQPETSLDEVIRVIDRNDIQRVVVVDKDGLLLGLISDRDLLRFFKPQQEGILHLLGKAKHPFRQDPCQGDLGRCLMETTAGAVMITDLITVREEMLIEEAIGLMIDKGLKRLPVVDAEGRFKGMISRDSLLRTGYGPAH